jgi:hypothetical protein
MKKTPTYICGTVINNEEALPTFGLWHVRLIIYWGLHVIKYIIDFMEGY